MLVTVDQSMFEKLHVINLHFCPSIQRNWFTYSKNDLLIKQNLPIQKMQLILRKVNFSPHFTVNFSLFLVKTGNCWCYYPIRFKKLNGTHLKPWKRERDSFRECICRSQGLEKRYKDTDTWIIWVTISIHRGTVRNKVICITLFLVYIDIVTHGIRVSVSLCLFASFLLSRGFQGLKCISCNFSLLLGEHYRTQIKINLQKLFF